MSAIGDYVHYHTQNYLTWGINHVGVGGSSAADAGNFAQAQKEKITRASAQAGSLSASDRRELAQKLTWLMRPPEDQNVYGNGESADDYNQIWNALQPFFQSEFGDAVERIGRATANVFSGVQIEGFKKISPEKDQVGVKVSTIQSRLDKIYAALQNPNNVYTKAELNALNNIVAQIEAAKNSLVEEAKVKLANVSINPNAIIPLSESSDLIKAINAAAAASSGVTNLQKGTLFEYMIAVAPLIGKKLTGEALQRAIGEAISGSVVGDVRTSVTFDPQDFDTNADLKGILGGNYSFNINTNLYESNMASQDKVDVQLQMRPEGPRIKVSAKNINLSGANSRGVHIVSSASLLAMLASVGNHAFVTHYLNQHALGLGGSSIYSDSVDALKLSIIQQALQGYKKGSDSADVFIINDNITGTVQIYNMSDLMAKIMSTGIVGDFVSMEPDLGSINLQNNWHDNSYAGRITDILAQIQSYKVTIALQPGLFY